MLGQSIEAAAKIVSAQLTKFSIKTWPQVFRFGEFIDTNVLGAIDTSELLYFDISTPNFNVFFEFGYAVGRGKPVIALVNTALDQAGEYLQEIGLFDTVGQGRYENSASLAEILASEDIPRPVLPSSYEINFAQPLFLLKSRANFEGMARAVSALTDTYTQFRVFDPTEDPRIGLREAVQQVAESTGVLCAVISRQIHDAENHNLRAAFLSGLTRGMDRELLLLNMSSKSLPLDVRDYAKSGAALEDIQTHVHAFALRSLARLQKVSSKPPPLTGNPIQGISLGNTAAENEFRLLPEYFVETSAFRAAIEGQGRIVIGRKGSGKTAIFTEMARQLGDRRGRLIISLKPEGYQLRKFKDNLIEFLSEGTKEHTVAAFWEYALLLEICHQCISADEKYLGRDPEVSKLLPPLRAKYGMDDYVIEGDFSERTLLLLNEIERRYRARGSTGSRREFLSRAELTELIYSHDINALRRDITEYLAIKSQLVILIDNLDKGWEASGVSPDDLLMLRGLIEVGRKLERTLARADVPSFCLVFLRNDIYELLLDRTPDRGKEGKIAIDWTDRDRLKQVVQRRLSVSTRGTRHWGNVATSHVNGRGSLEWVIDRCLMRPRYLIDLVNRCLGAAASRSHNLIETSDFQQAYDSFSLDALVNTNLEIRDVNPIYFDAIFALRGLRSRTSRIAVSLALLGREFAEEEHSSIIEMLTWYGVLGVVDDKGATTFIYEVEYNSHVLEQIRSNRNADDEMFEVNRAFWPALKIEDPEGNDAQIPLVLGPAV